MTDKNLPAKPQSCVLLKSGLELWIDTQYVDTLTQTIADTTQRFVKIKGQLVNPYEIAGIFTAEAMAERIRRKNGQWTCQWGTWHDKGQVCECIDPRMTEEVTAFVEGIGPIKYKRKRIDL
jgi:hypothetical protein